MYKIYFLKEGTHTDSNQELESYTRKDLEEIKNSYSPNLFKAPVVIGHSDDIKALYENDKAPAYGWVEELGLDSKGLYANVNLVKEFEDLIERDVPPYKYVSAAIYERDNPFNPTNGKNKYIRHIAFLGSTPPAIKGLPGIVKMYSEMTVQNTKSLFNILKVDNNNQKETMKKYMTDDFDNYQETIKLPNPETASNEEIKSFLDNNSFDFLVYILTEGEYGYPGEITSFDVMPSEENNYLFNSDTNSFSGIFYDDTSSEVDGYRFEIKKSGEGWTSSYIPVNQVESENLDNFAEETEEEFVVEESNSNELTPTDEASLSAGNLPEENSKINSEEEGEEVEEEDLKAELDLMRSETRNLRNEILKLKNELNEMKMEEYRAYAEGFSNILDGTNVSTNQLASLLFQIDISNSKKSSLTKAYSELTTEKPVDLLKKILIETKNKVNSRSVISYGEFMPEEDTIEGGQGESFSTYGTRPIGAVYSDEGLSTHRQVLEYCQKNGLDSKNPEQYLTAYKAISR